MDNEEYELQGAGGPIMITDGTIRNFKYKVASIISMDDLTVIEELKDKDGVDLLMDASEAVPYNIKTIALPAGTVLKVAGDDWYSACELTAGKVACYLKLEKGLPVRI